MVVVTPLNKTQLADETEQEFIQRICSLKKTFRWNWHKVAEHLNNELGLNYSYSWYYRNYKNGAFTYVPEYHTTATTDENFETFQSIPDYEIDSLDVDCSEEAISTSKESDELHKLQLKKVEVCDLLTQNRAYIRRLSREQTIRDIAHDYAMIMNKDKLLKSSSIDYPKNSNSIAEGVLLLSDWHYGMVCDNPWNKFDPEICKDRVSKLLHKVINLVNYNGIDHIHVLDLADLIAGRIHTQIRIESRFDVITQTMEVAEILAEFLDEISNHCKVSFYSCLDNHSRLEPNKKESMDLESLARLIPWYLKERLSSNNNIEICENEYGADIITCTVMGHKVIGVHGDNDRPNTALERLSLMTHQHYAMLCTAHLHHMALEESHQSMVVSNGCLMGVDRYAEKLRLTSDPSQTFIIVTEDNICESIHRIVLK